jgi:hypothetical protein
VVRMIDEDESGMLDMLRRFAAAEDVVHEPAGLEQAVLDDLSKR